MKYQIIGDMGKILTTVEHVEFIRHEDGFWSLMDSGHDLLYAIKDVFVTRIQPTD